MPGWRLRARAVIRKALSEYQGDRKDAAAVRKVLSAVYPFGERRYTPYKVWLEEVTKAVTEIAIADGTPLSRACGACGAAPGKPCREYAKTWEIGTHYPLIDGFHEARINPPPPGNGPLFGD